MPKGFNADDIRKLWKDINEQQQMLLDTLAEEESSISKIFDIRSRQHSAELKYQDELRKLQNMQAAFSSKQEEALANNLKIHKGTFNAIKKQIDAQKKLVKNAERRLKVNQAIVSTFKTMGTLLTGSFDGIKEFLMASDESIKSINLELGLSGERAATLRDNFEDSAGFAARLGASVADLANIQRQFANETGRARALSEDSLEAITLIGKGTGLNIELAAQLAGQFELMGLNARSTADYVQSVVETTERMGVNTTKVLKNVSANFKTLQKFTFQQGVRGFAQMAGYAEKFKVDMAAMLDSAERARTLEGAVELAAELQVMGGEFAKSDPFEVLFLSRNDPAKFTEKINQMTKGMATFRKTADGTFETFISPADIDRLNKVGEALGMDTGQLVEQARRMAEIQRMRQQMLSTDLGAEQREIVEGLAQFQTDTGKFVVDIAGTTKDIANLTKNDVRVLEAQKATLEERALASQTFDQVLQNTITELKASLLPLLQGINSVLATIRPYVTSFGDWVGDLSKGNKEWLKVGGMLMGGALLWKSVASPIVSGLGGLFKSGAVKTATSVASTQTITGGAARGAAGGGGLGGLATGAGVGLAGLGVGGGIAIAAKGISSLADAMKDLDPKQAEALSSIVTSISILTGVAALAAVGITAFGAGSAAAAPGLLAFGGAIALVGAGIGVASAGIGFMAEGMGNLLSNADPAIIMKMAAGMTSLASASILFANPLSMIGLASMAGSVLTMSKAGLGMEQVGNAFENISVVLQGSSSQLKEIQNVIQTIAATEIGNNSAISKLSNILSSPLKVEFADKEVGLVAKIDLNIDGQRAFEQLNIARKVEIKQIDYQNGKAAPRAT